MLKRFLAFLIYLTLTAPLVSATSSCPSVSSANNTDLSMVALYPNPNSGENEWIELSNDGDETVDLSAFTLEDSTAKPWTPSGTLEAGETVQVSGFSFQLNNSNETVTLKTSSGTVLDTWTYATSTKGQILSRGAESSTSTAATSTAATTTPADTAPAPTTTPSRWPDFSEALPNPAGSDNESEWIELYNPYSEVLTLTGLKLDDEEGGSTPFSLTGTLAGESYLLLSITETHLTLNNTEDHVRLLGVNNEILWDLPYTGGSEAKSFAVLAGAYDWTDNPTPGEENESGSESATSDEEDEASPDSNYQNGDLSEEVTITEIFPNPEGNDAEDEWIELTNNGSETVNLGNWTLTDASGKTYVVPDSTVIGPGETLVVYRGTSDISLNNSNESITLSDYSGETMSEVSYDSSEEDESYAQIEVEATSSTQASTSGLDNPSFSTWQWVTPSPGELNPIWKQIKGVVSEWDGQWLTMNDGLSNWTFEADNTQENALLFKMGNSIVVEASLSNGIYQIMHSELVSSAAENPTKAFPWSWLLSGLGASGWMGYELYKKRKKVWTLPPQVLN